MAEVNKRYCIGLDQSYTDTGIAVVQDGKVLFVGHENFEGCKLRYDKRKRLIKRLEKLIDKCKSKGDVLVTIEAVRLFSGSNPHISVNYIFGTCALVGAIVDCCITKDVPITWVETRSWKKGVLGSSKPSQKPLEGVKDKNKIASILYCINLGLKEKISYKVQQGKNKGQIRYNDNIADAICIAMCGYKGYKLKSLDSF